MASVQNKKKWYALQVQTGFEKQFVKILPKILKEKGYDINEDDLFLPVEEVIDIRKGKRTVSERFLYQSYLFIRADMTDNLQKVLIRMPRIIGIIGKPYKPSMIDEKEIESIKNRIEKSKDTPRLSIIYKIDDRVRVKDGAFSDFSGIVESVDDAKARLKIMVTIFGRSTPLELDYDQVEKI